MTETGSVFLVLSVVWFVFVAWWMLQVRSGLSEIASLLRDVRKSLWITTGEDQDEEEDVDENVDENVDEDAT